MGFFKLSKGLVAIGISLFLNATNALAHASLTASTPSNGSTLIEAPKMVLLEFAEAVQLVRVNIETDEGDEKLMVGKKGFHKDYILGTESQSKGKHTLRWRALANDGHVIKGEVTFTVKGE